MIHIKCVELYIQRIFVGIVIEIDKAVVEQETRVAFFPIRVKDLVTTLYIFESFYDKAFSIISVCPSSLSWPLMV